MTTNDVSLPTFKIIISGIVQGVGFRPFIYSLAKDFKLNGYVINSSLGVEIYLNILSSDLNVFIDKITVSAPPLAHITNISFTEITSKIFTDFTIKKSDFSQGITLVSPDTAICEDCSKELFDIDDKRYLYPFINCTNCGPRYSIIKSIPYDRAETTMKSFEMCDKCNAEYENPEDRRFHAQPNCCPVCGPKITYFNFTQNTKPPKGGYTVKQEGSEAIKQIAAHIDNGEIIALKGLGGYHLICDALNNEAIRSLRKLKKRPSKPLAIMCLDKNILSKANLKITEAEKNLFYSPSSPIVIINWHNHPLSSLINPANDKIGIMQAYTPLHKILLNELKTDFIVATSGNIKDEPICKTIVEAEDKLSAYTPHFLHHNREIHTAIDDSVTTIVNEKPYILRRARGFAPYPVMLPKKLSKCVIGLGAHLKSTITIGIENYGFVSQYIGDLDNPETVNLYSEIIDKMKNLFHVAPELILIDKHPEYYSTQYANKQNLPISSIQHHHAHMYACMAENGLTDNVIGVIFDGTGLGDDNTIWGGEFFIKQGNIQRTHHLKYVMQPGMDSAAKNPYRMLISYLHNSDLLDMYEDMLIAQFQISADEIKLIKNMISNKINSINTSSMGRLFEAIGSLLSGIKTNEYEGHTAILLESIATDLTTDIYKIEVKDDLILIDLLIKEIMADFTKNIPKYIISTKFHNSIAHLITQTCLTLSQKYKLTDIVLSGGVFQNITLLNKTIVELTKVGLTSHIHSKVPSNDGCISLGQVYSYCLNQY